MNNNVWYKEILMVSIAAILFLITLYIMNLSSCAFEFNLYENIQTCAFEKTFLIRF